MNQNLNKLADQIREQFPRLDVRTDQCDVVRVYARGVLVSIQQKGEEFIADFMSLDGNYDFETPIIKSLSSSEIGAFDVKVLEALVDLVPSWK